MKQRIIQTAHDGRVRSRRMVTAAVLATTAMIALAACSTPAASTPSATSGGNAAQVATAQQAVAHLEAEPAPIVLNLDPLTKPAALAGKTIFIIPVATVIFSTYVSSLQSAVAAAGGQTQVCDGQINPSTIDSCFKQAASSNVVGVVTFAIPYQLVPNSYDGLTAAKIPTLAAFQGAQGAASGPYLAFDSSVPFLTTVAQAAVNYVIADSQGTANVLYVGSTDSADSKAINAATHDALTSGCSNCTFTDASIPTAQLSDLGSIVSAALLSNPNLNWSMNADVEAFGGPVSAAIDSAGKASSIPVGGPGGGLGPVQLVQNGSAKFVSLISPDLIAWNALDAFLRLSDGQTLPATYPTVNRIIDQSNVAELTLTPEAAISYDWFGDPTFHNQYLKLWGVS